MKTIIFAQNPSSALELVTAAQVLGSTEIVQVSLTGAVEKTAASTVATVAVPDNTAYEDAYESIAAWFAGQNADLVLAEPTRRLKIVVGKLAAAYETSAIGNITNLDNDVVSARYFGGLADKKLKVTTPRAFYYIGAGSFEAAEVNEDASIVRIEWVAPKDTLEVLDRQELSSGMTDLTKSEVVIACGRGFSEQADLGPAFELATKLGAGVGCTRPLTEAVDWFPREASIGVSGQMVKPKVYVGVGISGQMQHMIGANTSEVIIAINKDKTAPIFKQCDIGIVGDLKQVLPALITAS
jgi:electron transfer flavoprotein alpha subunit